MCIWVYICFPRKKKLKKPFLLGTGKVDPVLQPWLAVWSYRVGSLIPPPVELDDGPWVMSTQMSSWVQTFKKHELHCFSHSVHFSRAKTILNPLFACQTRNNYVQMRKQATNTGFPNPSTKLNASWNPCLFDKIRFQYNCAPETSRASNHVFSDLTSWPVNLSLPVMFTGQKQGVINSHFTLIGAGYWARRPLCNGFPSQLCRDTPPFNINGGKFPCNSLIYWIFLVGSYYALFKAPVWSPNNQNLSLTNPKTPTSYYENARSEPYHLKHYGITRKIPLKYSWTVDASEILKLRCNPVNFWDIYTPED